MISDKGVLPLFIPNSLGYPTDIKATTRTSAVIHEFGTQVKVSFKIFNFVKTFLAFLMPFLLSPYPFLSLRKA